MMKNSQDHIVKKLRLESDTKIPVLGLGTWALRGQQCVQSVMDALEIGYRHIDTADMYGNHIQIGEAIAKSGIKRRDLFITTKVPPHKLSRSLILSSTEKYLQDLGLDYVDLLLIHWPNPVFSTVGALEAFQELKEKGLIKTYGVSNFNKEKLKDVLDEGFDVVIDQVEFHPTENETDLKEYCDLKGVVITAYTPLGKGRDLDLKVVKDIAKKHGKPEAQVVINWIIGKGMVAIPKASSREHLQQNFNSLTWKLDKSDIKKIDGIE